MVRSASKNFRDVAIVTSPDDYKMILDEMKANNGEISLETRFRLASKAFRLTAAYDSYISSFLSTVDCNGEKVSEDPEFINMQFVKKETLRYGENPHQKASIYIDSEAEK